MKEITPSELKAWKDNGTPFQLIDIREEHEVAYCSIGGEHIPMDQVLDSIDRMREDVPVVVHCQSGKRSNAVVYAIERKFGRKNVYTLTGGIQGWGAEIDPDLQCFQ